MPERITRLVLTGSASHDPYLLLTLESTVGEFIP
jgi:hypothetical protein